MIALSAITTGVYVPGSGKRVTLRDVALEAGVSIKTASRVVNGEPAVNATVAVRVVEVVERLGWRGTRRLTAAHPNASREGGPALP